MEIKQINIFSILAVMLLITSCNGEVDVTFLNRAGAAVVCTNNVVTVNSAFSNGANWNDYIENQETNIFDISNTAVACNEDGVINGGTRDTEDAGADACLHAGEIRKIDVPLESSCNGLSLTESLGAFNWICDASSGNVAFYSVSLKKDKGLKDLLNSTGDGFRNNAVSISSTTCPGLYTSASSNWWNNTVRNLDGMTHQLGATGVTGVTGATNGVSGVLDLFTLDNTGALAGVGVIYTLIADMNAVGFNIQDHKISLVVYDNATLSFVGSGNNTCSNAAPSQGRIGTDRFCFISSNAKNFLWAEGNFEGDATSELRTMYFNYVKFARFQAINSFNASNGYGFRMEGTQFSRIMRLRLDNSFSALMIGNATTNTNNYFYDISISNSSRASLHFFSSNSSNENTFVKFLMTNSVDGILSAGTNNSDNTFSHMTISNNLGNGINDSNAGNSFSQILISNNGLHGIEHSGNTANFSQLAILNSALAGIELLDSDNNIYSENILIGGNGSGCIVDGLSTGNNISTAANCGGSGAGLTIVENVDITNIYLGLATNDTTNADSALISLGTGIVAQTSITDWFLFDSSFRMWGDGDNLSINDVTNQGGCFAGNCGVWDWRLDPTDNQIFNNSFNGTVVNNDFLAQAACPAAVGGDFTLQNNTGFNGTSSIYLVNAIEVMYDGIGNDDGLCQSNEACIYSPHFGAYQGEGDFTTKGTCIFQNGVGVTAVTDVTMYSY